MMTYLPTSHESAAVQAPRSSASALVLASIGFRFFVQTVTNTIIGALNCSRGGRCSGCLRFELFICRRDDLRVVQSGSYGRSCDLCPGPHFFLGASEGIEIGAAIENIDALGAFQRVHHNIAERRCQYFVKHLEGVAPEQ